MANKVVQVPHERELYVSLSKVGSQIKAVMPKSWDDEDFKRLLSCAAIQSRKWGRNDQERAQIISSLDKGSFIEAVTTAASCNIMPDGRRGYLITRQSRNANGGRGGYTVTFQADYKGLIDVAKRCDTRIQNIHADTIHENDVFEASEGSNRSFNHSIPRETLSTGRGEVQGAYAIVYYKDGHYDAEVLSLADLKKIMACSSANYGPNKDWPLQMHRKAAIRRLCKRLPETPDMARLMDVENADFDMAPQPKKPAMLEMKDLPPVQVKEEEPVIIENPGADVSRFQPEFIPDDPKPKAKAKKKAPAKKKATAKKEMTDKLAKELEAKRKALLAIIGEQVDTADKKGMRLSVNIGEIDWEGMTLDDIETMAADITEEVETGLPF